jgi:hypothetical protein
MIPVPVLTPRLSSYWVNLVTPVPRGIAKPLIDSLKHEVVCSEHAIAEYVPDPEGGLLGYDTAVQFALAKIRDAQVQTRWSNASLPDAPADPLPSDPDWSGGSVYTDSRKADCAANAETLWRVIEGVGGSTAGTRSRWRGPCAAGWTGSPEGSGCGVGATTRSGSISVTPSTGGASKRSSGESCCGCARK